MSVRPARASRPASSVLPDGSDAKRCSTMSDSSAPVSERYSAHRVCNCDRRAGEMFCSRAQRTMGAINTKGRTPWSSSARAETSEANSAATGSMLPR